MLMKAKSHNKLLINILTITWRKPEDKQTGNAKHFLEKPSLGERSEWLPFYMCQKQNNCFADGGQRRDTWKME